MQYAKQIIGIALYAYGLFIIAGYWVFWIRFVAMAFGYGYVKLSSMAPFVGPFFILAGAFIFGDPLQKTLGWWVLLIDLNTYDFLISAPLAVLLNLRPKKTQEDDDSDKVSNA
jgi:hypothetical protein